MTLPPAGGALENASLEIDAGHDGMPDCWQSEGNGTSEHTFALTSTAHSGRHGELVTVAGFRSGSQALVMSMSPGCAPRAVARHGYQFGVWYRGTGRMRFAAYYRTSSSTWRFWTHGPWLSPASGWIHARYATPPTPKGTTSVSFGIALRSVGAVTSDDYTLADLGPAPTSSAPPPAAGYVTTVQPPSEVFRLPGDATCARRVHNSTWEPRPGNYGRNHTLVDPDAVHNSFAARPRSRLGQYDPRWDSWLLPRVDGQFTGTTDEIIQWAACKWGLPDNYLRAEADVESTWFQYYVYRTGRCVDQRGCGDWFSFELYSARVAYCQGLAALGGYDYQRDYGAGRCPKTFSIAGVMSWWNPAWGDYQWALNQSGTFPFTRDSAAMALDYLASQIRGCYQGWEWQLGRSYVAGDLWGCAGSWYSGSWHSAAADRYIQRVQADEGQQPWLAAGYRTERPSCSTAYGCVRPG